MVPSSASLESVSPQAHAMTAADRDRFESIVKLYERSWLQFNARRQYEFQVGLAYWTALAAGLAGSVSLSSFPRIPGGHATIIGFGVITVVLHWVWLIGIRRGHGMDQAIALHYQELLQTLSNSKFDGPLKGDAKASKQRMGRLTHPAGIFQIGVTALLATAFVLVNWNR